MRTLYSPAVEPQPWSGVPLGLGPFPRRIPSSRNDEYDPSMWIEGACCEIISTGTKTMKKMYRNGTGFQERYRLIRNGIFTDQFIQINYSWTGMNPQAIVMVPRNVTATVFFAHSKKSQSASGQSIGISLNDLKYGVDGFVVDVVNTEDYVDFQSEDGEFSKEVVVTAYPCGSNGIGVGV